MVSSTRPTADSPPVAPARIRYPDSDGKPMGETESHICAITYLFLALRRFLRHHEHVYVAADMLLYYEEGNPQAVRAPDVFVVRGVRRHKRRKYLLWEEGVAPCVIIEVTSASTRLEDLGTKRALYEMLGVTEYFLFDPLGEYLKPRLQGFRLKGGSYEPMSANTDGTLDSIELGLALRPQADLLRVVDPATGEVVRTLDEAEDQVEAETARALAEAERARNEERRADAAEAENARLRAELERLRDERGESDCG